MTSVVEKDLSEEQSRQIASAIREAIARRRISRQRLADDAKISISTLEKALSGRRPFTLATTIRLEEALGLSLRGREPAPSSTASANAPADLGAYSRAAVRWIEGTYLTIRPSFGEPGSLYAYRTEIFWNEDGPWLGFTEAERIDSAFAQTGQVSVPSQSGHVYLITNKFGQYRLITVSRPTISGEMHGILTTLLAGRGALLTPIAAPIALVPVAAFPEATYGRISPAHRSHDAYRKVLRRTVEEPFAVLLSG